MKKLSWVHILHFHREVELDEDEVAELEELGYSERKAKLLQIISSYEEDNAYTETYIAGPGVQHVYLTQEEPFEQQWYFIQED